MLMENIRKRKKNKNMKNLKREQKWLEFKLLINLRHLPKSLNVQL